MHGAFYDDDMTEKDQNHPDPLEQMLLRSDALHERLNELFDEAEFDGSDRGEAALGMCVVAMEHGTALRALMYSAPVSASAADDMTAFIISAMLWIAPLFGGRGTSSDKKWCPLALLRAFCSFKYPASLWTARIMSLLR